MAEPFNIRRLENQSIRVHAHNTELYTYFIVFDVTVPYPILKPARIWCKVQSDFMLGFNLSVFHLKALYDKNVYKKSVNLCAPKTGAVKGRCLEGGALKRYIYCTYTKICLTATASPLFVTSPHTAAHVQRIQTTVKIHKYQKIERQP